MRRSAQQEQEQEQEQDQDQDQGRGLRIVRSDSRRSGHVGSGHDLCTRMSPAWQFDRRRKQWITLPSSRATSTGSRFKRQMFGGAGFRLLRERVSPARVSELL